MEPISTVAVLVSITAITSAVATTVVKFTKDLKAVSRRERRLLKFDVDGKEIKVEYDSGKFKPEEVNRIVEDLKSASE